MSCLSFGYDPLYGGGECMNDDIDIWLTATLVRLLNRVATLVSHQAFYRSGKKKRRKPLRLPLLNTTESSPDQVKWRQAFLDAFSARDSASARSHRSSFSISQPTPIRKATAFMIRRVFGWICSQV